MFLFGDTNIVIIIGLSKNFSLFYYIILVLAKLKKFYKKANHTEHYNYL